MTSYCRHYNVISAASLRRHEPAGNVHIFYFKIQSPNNRNRFFEETHKRKTVNNIKETDKDHPDTNSINYSLEGLYFNLRKLPLLYSSSYKSRFIVF